MSDVQKVLFLLGSARRGGNTELLARSAAEHLPADAEQTWIHMDDLQLPAMVDTRIIGGGTYPSPIGDERALLTATLDATDVVIVSPLYWYNLTSRLKLYFELWMGWMLLPEVQFKDRMRGKKLWLITTMSDEPAEEADFLIGILQHSAGYARMRWAGALVAVGGTRMGRVLENENALLRAKTFFSSGVESEQSLTETDAAIVAGGGHIAVPTKPGLFHGAAHHVEE